MAGMDAIDGSVLPVSQSTTVAELIRRSFAASVCVSSRTRRQRLMCPPRTMLKISFCFNTLSVIRSHGKRQRGICSCGYLGHPSGKCRCTPEQIARYRGRISGPLLDRIDLQIEVPSLPAEDLLAGRHGPGESSAAVRARVAAAATRQRARQGKPNGELQPKEVERWCALDAAGEALLRNAFARLSLSARAYHRILKVARTIADLAAAETLSAAHVAEAIGYRRLDRA